MPSTIDDNGSTAPKVAVFVRDAVLHALSLGPQATSERAAGPPWLGWCAVSLLRYADRQREVLADLGGPVVDARARAAVEARGWTILRTERRLYFRREASGEFVTLSRAGWQAPVVGDAIHPEDFATWVTSLAVGLDPQGHRAWALTNLFEDFEPATLPPTHYPEARLWRWIPSAPTIVSIVRLFENQGLLLRVGEGPLLRPAPELEALASAVLAEDFDVAGAAARWATHLADPEVPGARCAETRENAVASHRANVQRFLRTSKWPKQGLLPLLAKNFSGAELTWACARLLDGAGPDVASEVLRFLVRRSLPPTRAVADYLRTLPLERANTEAAAHAVEYLMDRHVEPDLAEARFRAFAALAEADRGPGTEIARYTQLALDHFYKDALRLIRCTLRSPVAWVVEDVAAALVALDLPWCRRELDDAYRENPRHAGTLQEALGRLEDRPEDIPSAIGPSSLATEAAWYRDNWPREYPADFDEQEEDSAEIDH